MSIYQTVLSKVYPQDKANHYMRGSWAAMLGSVVSLVTQGAVMYSVLNVSSRMNHRFATSVLIAVMLVIAAVVATMLAFGIGFWKEHRDLESNKAAIAAGEQPMHGVETADWQFTAWGAAPVVITLLAAAAVTYGSS